MCPLIASLEKARENWGGEWMGSILSFPSLAHGTQVADVLAHAQMYQDSCSPPLCSLNLGNMQENAW